MKKQVVQYAVMMSESHFNKLIECKFNKTETYCIKSDNGSALSINNGNIIDYCVFDYAVNSGPSRAIKTLQKTFDVVADGIIGAQTMSKIQQSKDIKIMIISFCAQRIVFLKSLNFCS